MKIYLCNKIRELRHRDGRTQEALADALGVTSQAVSRWEANGSYPDMELIPSIANYFGVTIDELFGYQNNRESKIERIIEKIYSYNIKIRADDEWIDECVSMLRESLAEFPQNERLLITLADTLTEAGWRKHQEWLYYDEEGFIQHDFDEHKKNEYWNEALKICENLVNNASDNTIVTRAIKIMVLLYRNIGETEKAISYAMRMPSLKNCSELLLATATDGKQQARYIGEFLLKSVNEISEQLVYGLIANSNLYKTDLPIEKVKGVISLFYLICDDGNLGIYHDSLIKLYLYLSRLQWEHGYHNEAFESLDEALKHAKALEEVCDGKEHDFTAPLVSFVKYQTKSNKGVVKSLPDEWPFWSYPDYSEIEKEIKADSRWKEWVTRCQNE